METDILPKYHKRNSFSDQYERAQVLFEHDSTAAGVENRKLATLQHMAYLIIILLLDHNKLYIYTYQPNKQAPDGAVAKKNSTQLWRALSKENIQTSN